jgi:hypothetical protein
MNKRPWRIVVLGAALCAVLPPRAAQAADAAPMPPATVGTAPRGPWVPPAQRLPAVHAPAQGAALQAQAMHKLKVQFEQAAAALPAARGALTREQARAAGLGFVERHFDEIDDVGRGAVRFDDLQRYLQRRQPGAAAR